jgi:hypothetical protein
MASNRSSKSKFIRAFAKRAAKSSVLKVLLSRSKTFARTREGKIGRLWSRPSRHGTSRILKFPRVGIGLDACLSLPKPTNGVAAPNARAGKVCQDAFVQGTSRVAARYPSLSLRIYAKLAPNARYGSSARWSPSYGFVIVLEAEASITQAK